MPAVKPKIIVLVGPTASGKSDLGVLLARTFGGEIISADSRQVYRGLDIGSGKITKKKMMRVPHFCLDIVSPNKIFTAKEYAEYAQKTIVDVIKKNKIPIIVGGTGFYIDTALGRVSLADVPPNPALRKKLAKKSAAQLFAILKKLNPERAKKIDAKNPVRLIRAIEVASKPLTPPPAGGSFPLRKGKKWRGISSEHAALVSPSILWIGIKHAPEELKKRIERRLVKRLPGIIREVKKLRKGGLSWKRLFELGLEYRFVSLYLRGKVSRANIKEQLETAIRQYTKRQMTWFKRNKQIHWITNTRQAQALIKRFLFT